MTLVLHGSWLPPDEERSACFPIWAEFVAETGVRRRKEPARAARYPRHPFAATTEQLRLAFPGPVLGEIAESSIAALMVLRLPSADGRPLPSPDLDPAFVPDGAVALAEWRVGAVASAADRWVETLLTLDAVRLPAGLILGEDLHYWAAVARFILSLSIRERFMPALVEEWGRPFARWRPLPDEPADARRRQTLIEAMPAVARAPAPDPDQPPPRPDALLDSAVAVTLDALARRAFAQARPKKARAQTRTGSAAEVWLAALAGEPDLTPGPHALALFRDQFRAWSRPAVEAADTFRICFRLDPPGLELDGGTVRPAEAWTLHFFLQATDDPSLLVPAADVWRVRGATGQFLNRRFANPQERLLAGLGRAARLFPPLEDGLRNATPEYCQLTTDQAFAFIREAALLLTADGFGVLAPGVDSRAALKLRLGGASKKGTSAGQPAFGWKQVVSFDWEIAIGEATLSREEFQALVRLKEPLVQVRGRWVELRPELMEQALGFFRRQQREGELGFAEALSLALAPDGDPALPLEGVTVEGDFAALLAGLQGSGARELLDEPPGFVGMLRPYQKAGVSWLRTLGRNGLGACLADDMGLGKSPQTIAALLHDRREGEPRPGPALIVCPTSLVGNWRRELSRFAPALRVLVHHGAERTKDGFASEAARHDVVISTYALLHRDAPELTAVDWNEVVLDEAQNIKNPSTRAAQAARALRARWRAALTGTPVENRLSDLWSIFHFLNPGYLGTASEFRARFANPIERAHDEAAASRLKRLTAPFLLRRLKSDKSVISDLPEKQEMKVFCTLTREQATLYQAVVGEQIEQLEGAEGIQRRGQVLAILTKLKQVCDHPALLLHDQSRLAGRSGKLARLGEMLEEVLAADERALVFTQYAEMGAMIKTYIEETLGTDVLFLHGGTPAKARDAMVARFQAEGRGPSVFVLSVKAGGTGLNLTRANHVFHFDRWWNPAVENQATDRAFRIGQQRNVQVHKYVCAGTFEETLDGLIEQKQALAESITGTGETWITELSTSDLRELFALRADAVGDQ